MSLIIPKSKVSPLIKCIQHASLERLNVCLWNQEPQNIVYKTMTKRSQCAYSTNGTHWGEYGLSLVAFSRPTQTTAGMFRHTHCIGLGLQHINIRWGCAAAAAAIDSTLMITYDSTDQPTPAISDNPPPLPSIYGWAMSRAVHAYRAPSMIH